MITHNGVAILLSEMMEFNEGEYTVSRSDGIVFKASSVYGNSFASSPQAAVEGARKQIDQAGKRVSLR